MVLVSVSKQETLKRKKGNKQTKVCVVSGRFAQLNGVSDFGRKGVFLSMWVTSTSLSPVLKRQLHSPE